MSGKRGRWADVTIRGSGINIRAWVDHRRDCGWLVPHFTDRGMTAMRELFRIDEGDEGPQYHRSAPWQDFSGVWCFKDGKTTVELECRRVKIGKEFFALTDSAPMRYCWEEMA